jgi:hypothetical protein
VTRKRKKRGDDLGVDERIILKCILKTHYGKAKVKQAWTGPEGARRLRLTDFKTISK